MPVRRIMHIDIVLVGKTELHNAKHILPARTLNELVSPDIDARPVHRVWIDRMAIDADTEPAETLKHLTASSEPASTRTPKPWCDLVDFDPVGNAPFRIEDDELHVRAKGRRRRDRLSDDNLLLKHHFAMVEDPGELLGNAVPDIKLAQIFGHPAP